MTDIFLRVLNMSIAASWLILAIILLRLLLRRAGGWVMPLLWAVAGVRLVLPVSIESVLSLVPSAETLSPETVRAASPAIDSGVEFIDRAVNPLMSAAFAREAAGPGALEGVTAIAAAVWLAGAAALLLYALAGRIGLGSRVRTAVMTEPGVYRSEHVEGPFVLGLFKPRVYLPYGLSPEDTEYVLAHERAHIDRHDILTRNIGYIILAIHWFNPLVWAAYALFCRDTEYACDERVARSLTPEGRAGYSEALLRCASGRARRAACPPAFGEAGVKGRIKSVLNYKKPGVWLGAAAAVCVVILAVCFLTNPDRSPGGFSAEDVELAGETSGAAPEPVLAELREYVAEEARWWESYALEEGETRKIVRAAVTGVAEQPTEAVCQGGTLTFYVLNYEIELEPEQEFEAAGSCHPTSAWDSAENPACLLFSRTDGDWAYVGCVDLSSAGAAAERNPAAGEWTAAAQQLYALYAEPVKPENITLTAEGAAPEEHVEAILEYAAGQMNSFLAYEAPAGASAIEARVEGIEPMLDGLRELAGPDGSVHEIGVYYAPWSLEYLPNQEVFGGNGVIIAYADSTGSFCAELDPLVVQSEYGGSISAAAYALIYGEGSASAEPDSE